MKKPFPRDPTFARLVKDHMQRLGLGISDLAVLLEISPGTIYKWLRGDLAPHPLMRQAILYRLDQQKDYRYNAKEIAEALKAYRLSGPSEAPPPGRRSDTAQSR